jgi:glycosyltransferase involved in cell wall biosynthesis
MKIITISANTSWYLFNFRASTIRKLRDGGFRVVCLTPDDEYRHKLVSEVGCEWLPLAMNNKGSNPFQDAGLVWQFFRHYKKLKPAAALHFTIKNNVYGTWAARSLGIPVINNISGLGTAFIHRGFVSFVVRLLYRTSQPFAHCIFCQNEDDLAQLVAAKLVPPRLLKLLPGSGVDLNRFRPELNKDHGGSFRFLYAGRMLADKGLGELISAVSLLNRTEPRCVLWLSGFSDAGNSSAISNDQLNEWAAQPWIEWLGPTDHIEKIYANVDCVVLPSYREGMPRSLLEAGAMGRPVVATNVPGCRHIVEDGFNGLLCEARSSDSLHQAMRRMMNMGTEDRKKMGHNGRTRVAERFGEQLVVETTIEAVKSAINFSEPN